MQQSKKIDNFDNTDTLSEDTSNTCNLRYLREVPGSTIDIDTINYFCTTYIKQNKIELTNKKTDITANIFDSYTELLEKHREEFYVCSPLFMQWYTEYDLHNYILTNFEKIQQSLVANTVSILIENNMIK